MESLFTIVLSKGAYVVRESDAERVLRAIDERSGHVLVEADILGDGCAFVKVRIAIAHVVAVISNDRLKSRQPAHLTVV